jgi:hypothetical protein
MHSPLPKSSLKPRLIGASLTRLKSVLKPRSAASVAPAAGSTLSRRMLLKNAAQNSPGSPTAGAANDSSPSQQTGGVGPENRRRSPRRTINRMAKIQFGAGTPPRNCMINDISAGGVRLKVEGFEVPDAFVLFVNVGGAPRECIYRVVWRLESEIGAAFVRFVKRTNQGAVR